MYVSEYTFDHLRKAENERFSRELELRRIARERAADRAPNTRGGLRARIQHLLHPEYTPARRLSHS